MPPIPPFWFKQRQCKMETAGDEMLKVTGPNLGEAFLRIGRCDNNRWRAALLVKADGPQAASTECNFDSATEAWEAAFELYRSHIIV